jgi:hypothetical protein
MEAGPGIGVCCAHQDYDGNLAHESSTIKHSSVDEEEQLRSGAEAAYLGSFRVLDGEALGGAILR